METACFPSQRGLQSSFQPFRPRSLPIVFFFPFYSSQGQIALRFLPLAPPTSLSAFPSFRSARHLPETPLQKRLPFCGPLLSLASPGFSSTTDNVLLSNKIRPKQIFSAPPVFYCAGPPGSSPISADDSGQVLRFFPPHFPYPYSIWLTMPALLTSVKITIPWEFPPPFSDGVAFLSAVAPHPDILFFPTFLRSPLTFNVPCFFDAVSRTPHVKTRNATGLALYLPFNECLSPVSPLPSTSLRSTRP